MLTSCPSWEESPPPACWGSRNSVFLAAPFWRGASISLSWRSEFQNQMSPVQIKVSAGLALLGGFTLPATTPSFRFWALPPPSKPAAQHLPSALASCLSQGKTLAVILGLPQIIQDNLSSQNSHPNPTRMVPLPCKWPSAQTLRLGYGHFSVYYRV